MAGAVEVEVAIGYSRCRGKVAFPSKYMSIETNIIDNFIKHQYAKPLAGHNAQAPGISKTKTQNAFFLLTWNPSQQIKVIQLLTVTENVPLDLTGVDPGHEVLHVTCNQESRIIDNLGTDTDVALLDESGSL